MVQPVGRGVDKYCNEFAYLGCIASRSRDEELKGQRAFVVYKRALANGETYWFK